MTKFTCVLNSNVEDDAQWYRFIKDTGTTIIIDPDDDKNITISTHIGNTINSSFTITNAINSHTGYYWVGLPSDDVCNVSLTVTTSA